MIRRTQLEFEADQLDLELYRCLSIVERMQKSFPSAAKELATVYSAVRKARGEIRSLMSKEDLTKTS